ncbi:MAG: GNAT family N-acetyltransferase [Pseudomonadota bacterium]
MLWPDPRPALPSEAAALSALALRSKAHWGYDAAFMAACVAPLTLTPADFDAMEIAVIDGPTGPAAFAAIEVAGDTAHLDKAFVDQAAIGHGLGRRLMTWATNRAHARGATHMMIASDPYAAPFYTAMGARTVGRVASEALPGRTLPLMRIDLTDG